LKTSYSFEPVVHVHC